MLCVLDDLTGARSSSSNVSDTFDAIICHTANHQVNVTCSKISEKNSEGYDAQVNFVLRKSQSTSVEVNSKQEINAIMSQFA